MKKRKTLCIECAKPLSHLMVQTSQVYGLLMMSQGDNKEKKSGPLQVRVYK